MLRNRQNLGRARWAALGATATFVAWLLLAAGAQAMVVNISAIRQASPYDQGSDAGVAFVPGTSPAGVQSSGAQIVTSSGNCAVDSALQAMMTGPTPGLLCYHGGSVVGKNETFALVWDPNPNRDYAASYVEQFLRDVANGSGQLTSPFADTAQYGGPDQSTGTASPAANSSVFGGGYDYSNSYPASGCPVSGTWHYYLPPSGIYTDTSNTHCLTDAQLKAELTTMIQDHGLDQANELTPGHTPLINLLLPPGVETCFDAAGNLCSANGDGNGADPVHAQAQFCSYHSQLHLPDGNVVDYVVLPWTPQTTCDEPDAPAFPTPVVPPDQLATDMGARLVSPLSQAEIAAIVNPGVGDGWFAQDGSEINDNGCVMLPNQLDSVSVGGTTYFLQREFNNGGMVVNDPFALPCTPSVGLQPTFVAPSAVNAGDLVQFDGSKSPSTLLIPNGNYVWNFGDGTSATGPSVVHQYSTGGTYTVTLTVTDRGGDTTSAGQTVVVLSANGLPVPPTNPPTGTGNGNGNIGSSGPLKVRIQLMPEGLRGVLRSGIFLSVSSNQPADGIATVSIPRSVARKAHLKVGRSPSVAIGRGTLSQVKDGTVRLSLHLSHGVASKLKHFKHLTFTISLSLFGSGGNHLTLDAAGRY